MLQVFNPQCSLCQPQPPTTMSEIFSGQVSLDGDKKALGTSKFYDELRVEIKSNWNIACCLYHLVVTA